MKCRVVKANYKYLIGGIQFTAECNWIDGMFSYLFDRYNICPCIQKLKWICGTKQKNWLLMKLWFESILNYTSLSVNINWKSVESVSSSLMHFRLKSVRFERPAERLIQSIVIWFDIDVASDYRITHHEYLLRHYSKIGWQILSSGFYELWTWWPFAFGKRVLISCDKC